MKIKFITKIIENISNILHVDYIFTTDADIKVIFTGEQIEAHLSKNVKYFVLHDKVASKTQRLQVVITYTDLTTDTFVFAPLKDIEWVDPKLISTQTLPSTVDWLKPLIRKNTNTVYEDTNFSKHTIFQILKSKANDAKTASGITKGTKNLVYYSIGGKLEFLDTLKLSLTTLFTKGGDNFDVLFICPQTWVDSINEIVSPYNRTVHFLIVPEENDGIKITLNRIKIYDFESINTYKHILYLDADIIINGNIDPIFESTILKKLNTACNRNITTGNHRGVFHSLRYLPADDENLPNLELNRPFNSGQFSFKNSVQMKMHFDNVKWLSEVWPGEYFTDQAFMCTYFCFFGLTTPTLQQYVDLHHITLDAEFEDNKLITHFIGNCQNATSKTHAMKQYASL